MLRSNKRLRIIQRLAVVQTAAQAVPEGNDSNGLRDGKIGASHSRLGLHDQRPGVLAHHVRQVGLGFVQLMFRLPDRGDVHH